MSIRNYAYTLIDFLRLPRPAGWRGAKKINLLSANWRTGVNYDHKINKKAGGSCPPAFKMMPGIYIDLNYLL
jgi:hypothetical protein